MRILSILCLVALIAVLVIVAGCERKVVNENKSENNENLVGCFGCHGETSFNGALLQAQGEWQHSIHASGNSVDYTNRKGSDCMQCHNHKGFVDYITKGAIDTLYFAVSSIHCFTCHAPHETGNLELRTEAPYTLKNGIVFDHGAANLCANCHHSRTALTTDLGTADTVKVTTRFGPHHGPQADLLQGTHGFQHAGYTYTSSTHATAVTEACIGCHMGNPQEHDGYDIGGHSFNMRFYNEEQAAEYTLVGVCKTCHSTADSLNFETGDDVDGDGTEERFQTEMDGLADSLRSLLIVHEMKDTLLVLQSNGTYLVKNNIWVKKDVAGAAYNYMAYQEDRSRGVHNPLYIASLLKNSYEWLKANPTARQ